MLVPVPIHKSERELGLIYHVRRPDVPEPPPLPRCAECHCIIAIFGGRRRGKYCGLHSPARLGRGTSGKKSLGEWLNSPKSLHGMAVLVLTLLSVIITPICHAQGGNLGSSSSPVVNRQGIPLPGVNIAVCQPLTTTSTVITSNLAILTFASNPVLAGFTPGQPILVAGYTGGDTYLNAGTLTNGQIVGGWTILSVSSSTITFQIIAANATASSLGTVLQQGVNGTATCGGLSTVYATPNTSGPTSSNPFQSDQLGNWNVFAASGTYYVQFYGTSLTSTLREIVVGVSGSGSNILPLNNTFTGTNTFTNTSTFNGEAFFKSGAPWYDVQAFGAKGDCTTNDTAAILATANQALTDLQGSSGSGGVIYFSHSACPYIIGNITIPSGTPYGWLVFVFDQSLSVLPGNTISIPGKYDAFIGRSGGFQGASGSQPAAPNSTWLQSGSAGSTPLVKLIPASGGAAPTVEQIYFRGINIVGNSSGPSVLMQDNGAGIGVTYVLMKEGVVQNLSTGTLISAIPTSSSAVVGYNFRAYDTQFITSAPGQAMQFTNFGQIVLHDNYGTGYIVVTNSGIPSDGDIEIDDMEIEGLNNHDMLTLTGSYIQDISISHSKIPDTTGTVYMFNNISTGGPLGPVNLVMNVTGNIGSGLMNPAGSYPYLYCFGIGCPGYTVYNELASVPNPTLSTQVTPWFDMSGNFRCTLFSAASCGAIFGDVTVGALTATTAIIDGNPAITLTGSGTANHLLSYASGTSPVVAQDSGGVLPATQSVTPFQYITGYSTVTGAWSTALVGQPSGGAGSVNSAGQIPNSPYTWQTSDRTALLQRNDGSTAMTDTIPAANTTGFTGGWYATIINDGTNTWTGTTSGAFIGCSLYCPSSTTLVLRPGQVASITSADPTSGNWTVLAPSYPQTFGMLADLHGGPITAGVGLTTLYTVTAQGSYTVRSTLTCSGPGTANFAFNYVDAAIGSNSGSLGTPTCGSASLQNYPVNINAAPGAITFQITRSSSSTIYWSIELEGPF